MPIRRRFPWTRRFIRRYFPKVSEEVAYRWERRLSVAYFFLGWNALLAIGYLWYRGRQQRELTGDERIDKINRVKRLMSASQSETIRVLEYQGFTKVNDETLHVSHERPSLATRPGPGRVTADTDKPDQ